MSKLLQQKWQHEKLLHNSFDLNSHRTLAPGGILLGILRGVSARFFSQILTDFRPKNVIIHTRFQTWLLGRNYVIIIRLRSRHKDHSNSFRISIFLFVSYSFGIERIKMFIHSPSFLENPTRIQTKMDKVDTGPSVMAEGHAV